MAKDHRFTSAYLFGATCPLRGVGAAIVMPAANIEAMNEHLAEISYNVSVGAIALPILDGAGWHSSPRLQVPDNVVPLPSPAYAPERNPTENLWQYLRGNYLSHEVYENYEAVVSAGRDAWNALMKLPEVILSIGNRADAQVNTESRWYQSLSSSNRIRLAAPSRSSNWPARSDQRNSASPPPPSTRLAPSRYRITLMRASP